jgi:hypothetical protein
MLCLIGKFKKIIYSFPNRYFDDDHIILKSLNICSIIVIILLSPHKPFAPLGKLVNWFQIYGKLMHYCAIHRAKYFAYVYLCNMIFYTF